MTTLVTHYLTRFSLLQLKENVLNLDTLYATRNTDRPAPQPPATQKPASCSCCNWKGKVAESRKNYIMLATISEVELFCPRCNTYMGFVNKEL